MVGMLPSSLGCWSPPYLFLGGGLNSKRLAASLSLERNLCPVLPGPVLLWEAQVRDGNPHQQIL